MGFSENPLSLSVPDEHFKTWAVSNSQAAAAEAVAATRRAPRNKCVLGRSVGRARVRRRRRSRAESPGARRGRSLATLTVDDLLQRARPWCVRCVGCSRRARRALSRGRRSDFFGGRKPQQEFGVPRTWEDASYKLGENVHEFIGNYLHLALACVCCVLCAPPPPLAHPSRHTRRHPAAAPSRARRAACSRVHCAPSCAG